MGTVPINQCEAASDGAGDPRLQFTNVGVPIIHVMSQSDYLFGIDARRPDSDAPADRYRHYEMAGAAHATPDELQLRRGVGGHRQGRRPRPADDLQRGPAQPLPEPHLLRRDAAQPRPLGALRDRAAPRRPDHRAENGAGVLDEFGNVVGGLRSPYLDVPTSTWFGSSTGASFCCIAGHEVPFDRGAAGRSSTRPTAPTSARVVKDTARLVAGRYITAYDGLDLIREAAQADVP